MSSLGQEVETGPLLCPAPGFQDDPASAPFYSDSKRFGWSVLAGAGIQMCVSVFVPERRKSLNW